MLPTMRGGDRAWQERMPLEGLLKVGMESGDDEVVARGKKVRGAASGTAVAKTPATASETSTEALRAGSKSHVQVPDEPSTSGKAHGRSYRGAGGAGGTVVPTAVARNAAEGDGGRGIGGVRARSARSDSGRAWRAGVKSATRTKAAIGPRKKPPESKQKRKRGAAIAALEGADLFLNGNWDGIEKFATCKLPLYSVTWSKLKGDLYLSGPKMLRC